MNDLNYLVENLIVSIQIICNFIETYLLPLLFVEHAFPDKEQAKTSGNHDSLSRRDVHIALYCCEIPNGQAEWKLV